MSENLVISSQSTSISLMQLLVTEFTTHKTCPQFRPFDINDIFDAFLGNLTGWAFGRFLFHFLFFLEHLSNNERKSGRFYPRDIMGRFFGSFFIFHFSFFAVSVFFNPTISRG
jgi:hypothetical protein